MTEGEAEQGSSANPLAFDDDDDDDDEVHVLYDDDDDDDDDDVGVPPPAKKAKKADDLPPAEAGRASFRRLPAAAPRRSGTDSPAERTTPFACGLEPNLTLTHTE